MALKGSIEEFPLDEVLVLLAGTEKTGVLRVSSHPAALVDEVGSNAGSSAVWLSQGLMVGHEVDGARDPRDALFRCLRMTSGTFWFESAPPPADCYRGIEVGPFLEEWRSVAHQLAPVIESIRLAPDLSVKSVEFSADEWKLIARVAEMSSAGGAEGADVVEQLGKSAGLTTAEVVTGLASLVTRGLLIVYPPFDPPGRDIGTASGSPAPSVAREAEGVVPHGSPLVRMPSLSSDSARPTPAPRPGIYREQGGSAPTVPHLSVVPDVPELDELEAAISAPEGVEDPQELIAGIPSEEELAEWLGTVQPATGGGVGPVPATPEIPTPAIPMPEPPTPTPVRQVPANDIPIPEPHVPIYGQAEGGPTGVESGDPPFPGMPSAASLQPAYPGSDPVYPAPGPAYPESPAASVPGPSYPAPGPASVSPGPAYQAPGPSVAAPGPTYPEAPAGSVAEPAGQLAAQLADGPILGPPPPPGPPVPPNPGSAPVAVAEAAVPDPVEMAERPAPQGPGVVTTDEPDLLKWFISSVHQ